MDACCKCSCIRREKTRVNYIIDVIDPTDDLQIVIPRTITTHSAEGIHARLTHHFLSFEFHLTTQHVYFPVN
jgi:hypothetical protein